MTQKAIVLNPAQRKSLKALAHALNPVVMIGDKGLTSAVVKEIDQALDAHQLIKIRVLGDDRDLRLAMIEEIGELTLASPVQHIGKLLVFYRPNSDKPNLLSGKVSPSGEARRGSAKATATSKTSERPRRSAASPTKDRAASGQQTVRSTRGEAGRTDPAAPSARPRRRPA